MWTATYVEIALKEYVKSATVNKHSLTSIQQAVPFWGEQPSGNYLGPSGGMGFSYCVFMLIAVTCIRQEKLKKRVFGPAGRPVVPGNALP